MADHGERPDGTKLTRRTATALLATLAGCVAPPARRSLGAARVELADTACDPEIRMHTSAWAHPASASNVAQAEAHLGSVLQGWVGPVVRSFRESFVASMRARGVAVDLLASAAIGASDALPPGRVPVVRSSLSAGFVFKTYTSQNYAPFVEALVLVQGADGVPLYRKMYVATDRPYNPFSHYVPVSVHYTLGDRATVENDRDPAFAALSALAMHLAEQYAADFTE